MNPLDPVKWGAEAALAVTSTALKIATGAVRTAELLLGRNAGDDEEHRYGPADPAESRVASRDRETPGSATRGYTAPEPTAAAGASRGVAGTVDAPGDAAAAGSPDPTVPSVPRGERSANAMTPPTPESRVEHTQEEPDELVESEGAAEPRASLRVDAPWDGYDQLKAPEVVARVREGDEATKAVVRLYEQTHKKRKSVLAATE